MPLKITQSLSLLVLVVLPLTGSHCHAQQQESNPYVSYEVPFQNLLKFNRFLVNPTFSTVRENKSYLNFFHRSQAANYQDNQQDYFLSYSGRIDDRSGLGLSVYNQQEGVITNIGAMANYAYGVRLTDKSNLTFGFNIPYYHSSFDRGRAVTTEEDPLLGQLEENAIIAFQPGFNLSYGQFDVGVFAENLLDYNLRSGELMTAFPEKTFSGHLQYTYEFNAAGGVFSDARLLPLLRVRKTGQDALDYGGGMILDLPRLGWLQGGYDSFFGASVGTGFNLSRRLSLGYTIEKGLSESTDHLGTTHEISLAFSFVPNLTENMVYQEIAEDTGAFVMNEPTDDSYDRLLDKYMALEAKYEENNALLNELIFRQDSIELARVRDEERRFNLVMRSVKSEIKTVDNDPGQDLAANNTNDAPVKEVQAGYKRKNEFADPRKLVVRTMPAIDGIKNGHYVVANVFQTEKYLKQFMQQLEEQGLEPAYFKNPENGMHYVYLAHYENDIQARTAYLTGIGGKYKEQTWIMHVEDPYANMAKLEFED
ncbi:PorP/SprF family type IX secretion system membrane protein [Zeaxanthinibacter enoshimensis]|uniref:Type IX secretion system PorP/SprF family membrane protein n=1 Tax=Zeaxanthinibacter enoshimensis TaxID=392009 RepID=A0A4R6TGL5_9FLAO|nr:type IX secretion system membrane protein PorP/SprF [Zeaxanthinibacter enoshimensis]TDQ29387.1 type IX secretion system PorP/SprF family membrane protein [Zeaxanthinibacter enoshimensis]